MRGWWMVFAFAGTEAVFVKKFFMLLTLPCWKQETNGAGVLRRLQPVPVNSACHLLCCKVPSVAGEPALCSLAPSVCNLPLPVCNSYLTSSKITIE
ncbi:unnamed protein product [Urochloa humidicola]